MKEEDEQRRAENTVGNKGKAMFEVLVRSFF